MMGSTMKYKIIWPQGKNRLLQYLAGLVAGDGQLEPKRITITDASREFLETVGYYISKYLEVEPHIHKRSDANAYYLRVYSVYLIRVLEKVLQQLYERPTINYIRGFFDAEGGIYTEKYGKKDVHRYRNNFK